MPPFVAAQSRILIRKILSAGKSHILAQGIGVNLFSFSLNFNNDRLVGIAHLAAIRLSSNFVGKVAPNLLFLSDKDCSQSTARACWRSLSLSLSRF